MAVAKNDSGTNNVDSGGSYVTTLDLTTLTVSAGSEQCLVALLATGDGANISGVTMTWDQGGSNQAMTQVATVTTDRSSEAYVFRLVNPTTGNKILRATWVTSAGAVVAAVNFSGVDQTTPIVTADNQTPSGSSTTPAATVTSAANDATVVFSFLSAGTGDPNYTTPRDQTLLFTNNTMIDATAEASYALGGASNAHNFTTSVSASWGCLGVHIQAAGGGPAQTVTWVGYIG